MRAADPRWPHRTLDVPALRAAGHQPHPFRQFVLKVHSRCNLACRYCYIYQMADEGWRRQPTVMSPRIVSAAADRIAEHVSAHEIRGGKVVLHGGEPLLAGPDFIESLAVQLSRALPPWAAISLVMQTNGTRLDKPVLDVLLRHGVRVGVSIDGDRVGSRDRVYPSGRASYPAVTRALALLRTDRYRTLYGGLLCTIPIASDPVLTYQSLLEHEPPVIDFLLPHGTWSAPPPARPSDDSSPYADWLLEVFRRWAATAPPRPSIRLFDAIIAMLLGGPGGTEALGLAAADTIVIDTDGAIKQIDTLAAAYDGAADTGLSVLDDALDAALDHPAIVARQIGTAALCARCRACAVRDVCGGGYYPHRYRADDGFRNPSVYCPDLLRLITVIREYVTAEVARLATTTSVRCPR